MAETPAMKQWKAVKSKYPESVLFFQMGDFYEFFNEDAIEMAKALELKLTSRGKDKNAVPLAGIPVRAVDIYIPKLLEKGYSVVIADQLKTPEKIKGKLMFNRDVTRVLSPGAIVDPDYISKTLNNYLFTFFEGENIGFALIDVSTGQFYSGETSGRSRNLIIDEIVKYRPAELLLPDSYKGDQIINELKNIDSNLTVTFTTDSYYYFDTAINSLTGFFNVSNLQGFGIDPLMKPGITAAGALLSYLLDRKFKLDNVEKLNAVKNTNGMIIDSIARRNLELERNLRDGTEHNTLVECLDETKTPMGARLLRQWLRTPSLAIKTINDRLAAVEELMESYILREDLRETLSRMIDLERFATKVLYRKISPRDTLMLKDSLDNILMLKEQLGQTSNFKLKKIGSELQPLEDILTLIEVAIDNNAGSGLKECIRTGYSEQLDNLRDLSKNGKKWLSELENKEQKRIDKLANEQNIKSMPLKLGYTDGYGYFFSLSNRAKNQNLVPGDYRVFRSLKNSTRYMTDELEQLASKVLNAEEEIQKTEFELFNGIIDSIHEKIAALRKNGKLLAELDVLANYAAISSGRDYCKPVIHEGQKLLIKKGRHPVVDRLVPEGEFIPNDLLLGEEKRMQIVTGANMGGKSTFLRQSALICIMAQVGCFVPAEEAEIPLIDRIFTRVGVVDDITRNQSHFMVEMNETANILNNATERSLILLDEIGRGTSTSTGLAIAWSVVKHVLTKIRAKCLFATHFHQLNALEKYFDGISNCHVAVKQDKSGKIIFLHEIHPGGTNESYGMEVALLAGIPRSVIDNAREIHDSLEEEIIEERDSIPAIKKSKASILDFFQLEKTQESQQYPVEQKVDQKLKEMRDEVLKLDLSRITPVDALTYLFSLQKRLSDEED
ncbi:MAG: DNA mismatch repair protein MutS [Candidatus Hodarchaeales archaeon]